MANLKVNSGGSCSTTRHPIEIGPRRSGKVQSQPRFSIVKRPSSAPVSMQGWLHKQGSEGLMLWKKRWFVLSEYCLFYYKNSDEEKVLGSILLPSYKISPCTAVEGKLFRKKYSFKAEHANMRTYYFAADTRERLVQWMNAMSLATIAQEQTIGSKLLYNQEKKENISISVPNNRLANSTINTTFRNEPIRNGVQSHNMENYVQPLYVNAPPKPRRTAESAEQNYAKGNFTHIRSEGFNTESHSPIPRQQFKKMSSNVPLPPLNYNDRRTPDTYGLSPSCDVQACSPSKTPNKSISDYEELYNLTAAHSYYDNNNEVSHLSSYRSRKFEKLHYANRPHSVDFLQSEERNNNDELISESNESNNVSNRKCNYDTTTHVTPPRPKSSIDVISSDCYHWSEEQYAESMRKSAQYLVAKKTQPSFYKTVSGNKLPYNNVNSRTSAELGINGTSNANCAPPSQTNSEPQYKKCSSSSSSGLNKNEVDFMRSKSARISREKQFNGDDTEKNIDDVIHKRRNSLHLKEQHDRSSQQIQQREESMKRLLEWKQRMLQSPLSRKSSGCSQREVVKNEFFRDNTLKNMLNESSYPNLVSSSLSEDDNKNTRINQRYYSTGNEKKELLNESKKPLFKNADSDKKNVHRSSSSQSFNNSLDKYSGRISSEYEDSYTLNDDDAKRKQLRRISPMDGCEKIDTGSRTSVPDGSEVSIDENYSHNFVVSRQQCENRAKIINLTYRAKIDNNDSGLSSKFAEEEYDTISKVNSKNYPSTLQMQKQSPTQAQSQIQHLSRRKSVGELSNTRIGAVDKQDATSTNPDLQRNMLTEERECLPQNIVQDRIKVFEKPFSENTPEEKSHQMKSFPMISSLRAEFSDVAPSLPLSASSPGVFKTEENDVKDNDRTSVSTSGTSDNSSSSVIEHNVRETLSTIRRGAGYISNIKSARDLLLDVDWKMPTEKVDLKNWRFSPQSQKESDTRGTEECDDSVSGDECKADGNVNVESSSEDHYLPMAPSKKSALFTAPGDLFYHTRSNSASSASQIMILETLLSEDVENSYVEMTVGENNSKKLYPHSSSNGDATADIAVNKADKSPSSSSSLSSSSSSATVTAAAATHYEFLYKASSCGEPLYMEVYSKEKPKNVDEKEDESPKLSEYGGNLTLPDILNSSNATVARQLNDSSDADDEASKELDPLDLPRHPRFSLSDTFRPASYYLGNGGGCGGGLSDRNALGFSFDQPDSSDSDLVSPPPIPACPPTMDDDFNASLDLLPASSPVASTIDRANGRSHNLDLFASSTDENISLSETDDSFNSKTSYYSSKNPTLSVDKCKDTSDVESTDSYYSGNLIAAAAAPFEHGNGNNNESCNKSGVARSPAATFAQFSDNKDDIDRIQNFRFYENNRDFREVKPKYDDESTFSADEAFPTSPSTTNSTANFDVHLGAPYYYADILKSNETDKTTNKDFERKREQIDTAIVTPVSFHPPTNVTSVTTVATSAPGIITATPVSNTCTTLNNKRENIFENAAVASKRNDVGKKVNHIIEVENQLEKTRGVTLADMKNTVHNFRIGCKNVDDKNIYNSDVFQSKLGKVNYRSRTPDELLNDVSNFYARRSRVNSNDNDALFATAHHKPSGRRSRSFDRLLDADTSPRISENVNGIGETANSAVDVSSKWSWTVDDDVWEKDSVWRESLRRTSLRHARSLDDIDKEDKPSTKSGRQSADILSSEDMKKSSSSLKKITRDVIYVNDCVSAQIRKAKQNPKEYTEDYREIRKIKRCPRMLSAGDGNSGNANMGGTDEDTHYERLDPRATLNRNNIINNNNNSGGNNNCNSNNNYYYYEGARENITLADNMKQHGKHNTQPKTGAQSFLEEGVYPTKPPSFEIDREKLRQWDLMSSAPAVTHSAIQKYQTSDLQIHQMEQNANPATLVSDNTLPNSPASGSVSAIGCNQLPFQNRVTPSPSRILQNNDSKCSEQQQFLNNNDDFHLESRLTEKLNNSPSPSHYYAKRDDAWNLNVSAGELLGRTHEELVLLLIQLRRQSASVCKAMESCHCEIESQARLIELEKSEKLEHHLRLAELKSRLAELEKQYEKGRPLVNLVDNMVKLGSLYRIGPSNRYNQYGEYPLREKLEFNHKIQEQRLLAEERKEWERISPDHNRLQTKVEELYKLDRELQQESNLLQSLKQDKDLLEYALGGLKYKILSTQGNPLEMERYRRQQLLLEQELSHVRLVLARNSKKLEETVTANAKLEAELVVLRQKLQWNQRSSQEGLVAAPTVAALESELKRVQMLVGNLQRQRTELSVQVRQLTEKSKNLCHQMRHSPTDVVGTESLPGKKRGTNSWIETDLDNGVAQDVAIDKSPAVVPFFGSLSSVQSFGSSDFKKNDNVDPAFDSKNNIARTNEISSYCYRYPQESLGCEDIDISESDEKMKKFYGILPREKSQEIKTVRIVKRESERRQRDRDRSNIGIPITLNIKRSNLRENTSSEIEHNILNKVSEEKESHDNQLQQENETHLKTYYTPQKPDFMGTKTAEISLPFSSRKIIGSSQVVYDENEKRNKMYFRNSFEANEHNLTETFANSQKNNRDPCANKKSENKNGLTQLSPVYQSEAAKEIVQELVLNVDRKCNLNRRSVPKEKRRHHTISNNKPILPLDSCKSNTRARDDVDMERALRPRLNGTPDVVRSTLCRTDIIKYNAETIDNVIGTPGKILIPERYVPENMPALSQEEQDKRLRKADAIRKMLSESSALSAPENENEEETKKSPSNKNKFEETKRQREHILQLNQILAQQVMEKSKLVAGISSSNCH